ncbi:hypothetical protein Barb7_01308 [Bacteroidales bacterium Barb7]|nr:hypothetical protein Barb7_01308 [Bacteroidales bacterium Barb7]
MTLQPARRTTFHITMKPGELLPRLFTLTEISGGYFLLRCSTLADSFPLRSAMLCVARTFLPPVGERQTGRLNAAKVSNLVLHTLAARKIIRANARN